MDSVALVDNSFSTGYGIKVAAEVYGNVQPGKVTGALIFWCPPSFMLRSTAQLPCSGYISAEDGPPSCFY